MVFYVKKALNIFFRIDDIEDNSILRRGIPGKFWFHIIY